MWYLSGVELFKYHVEQIIPSFGLLTNSARNGKTTVEHSLYSAGNYNNRSINCSKWSPSTSFFRPHTSERKEKLKNHHISVNEVLERWSSVKFCLLGSKNSLYTTCTPLYLNISDQLKLADQYGEAIPHLKSSKGYENSYKAYTQMVELEARHN